MPNWVYNTVSVSGTPKQVEDFVAQAMKAVPHQKTTKVKDASGREWNDSVEGEWVMSEDNSPFSFWNFIAPPEDKWGEYFTTSGTKNGERLGETAYNWYNWNNANWGCKWDTGEVDFVETGFGSVSYNFQTPWGTPYGVWEAIANQYPELTVEITYEEEQGWGGELRLHDGCVDIVREWDIPTSHAEWNAIGRECYGCMFGEQDESSYYSDCPRETVTA